MNIHEYQAKALFKKFGVATTECHVAESPKEAVEKAKLIGERSVVKAQVHAGGRGKAGGVKLVNSYEEVEEFARKLLGTNLVTFQTDENGQPIHKLLIESPSDIARELYLSAVIDRASQRIVFMASTEGGMEIEEVAEKTPEKILKCEIDPLVGAQPYQARDFGFKLGLNPTQVKHFTKVYMGLYQLFVTHDLALLEVNPLVVTKQDELVCLDGKINFDANALYRQPDILAMRDPSQEDEKENQAAKHDLNYVSLDGNIGCMVNGAGLAMGTMDLIQSAGGKPANFLDVGGGATTERVTEAFKIILSDQNVKGILVNIFGGIVNCMTIADGIMQAVKQVEIKVPVVVRLEGNNAEAAREALNNSGLNLTSASSLTEAGQKVVELAGAK